jgi:hypothetical protein
LIGFFLEIYSKTEPGTKARCLGGGAGPVAAR